MEINYNKKRRNVFLRSLTLLNYTMLEAFLYLITVIINIIIFLMNKQEDALTNYKHIYDKVFYLGIIEGVFSFIFLVFWFIAKFSLTYIIEIEKYHFLLLRLEILRMNRIYMTMDLRT